MKFLRKPRPHSPHSPLGRSASARGHRHTAAGESARFNSLPRSSRPHHRKTMAWLTHDDRRELETHSRVLETSTQSESEPVSSRPRFCLPDVPADNNTSVFRQNMDVLEKLQNESVEKIHIQVQEYNSIPEPRTFEVSDPKSHDHDNSKSQDTRDTVLIDLEEEQEVLKLTKSCEEASPDDVKMSSSHQDEEDNSTVSSTTCNTSLPLDPSQCDHKSITYIIDCTEADCSVMVDVSEMEEGSQQDSKPSKNQDLSSLSSNFESLSVNESSISTSAHDPGDELPKAVTPEEADTDTCDTARDKKVPKKLAETSRPASSRKKTSARISSSRMSRPARTLTATETQNLRRVVPISRPGSAAKKVEKSSTENAVVRRTPRDQSMPARRGETQSRPARHHSLPPQVSKAERTVTPRKPTAKPVRNIPKPPPEEKMCRSTLRAMAEAQAKAQAAAPGGSAPQTPINSRKSSKLPNFARNTFAYTSRTNLPDQSVPGTPTKSGTLARTDSHVAPGSKANSISSGHSGQGDGNPTGSIRRVQSVRASTRNTRHSDTPPPQPGPDRSRKGSSFSERSVPTRPDPDKSSSSSRISKPIWK